MSWIIYTIFGVLLFSITNYVEKFIIDKKIKEPLFLAITSGPTYLIFAIAIFLFAHINPVTFVQFAALISSGIFLILYLLPYYTALKSEETSRLIPLFEFVPIFVLIFSFIFLKEKLEIKELVGFAFILTGGIGISLKKFDLGIFALRKSFFLLILSSLFYSVVPILFKYVVLSLDFWTAFFYQSIGAFIGTVLILFYPPYRKIFRKQWKKLPVLPTFFLFLNHGIGSFGELAISFAYFLAPVALVTVIAGTQPFFVLLIGVILSVWFPHIIEEDIKKSTILLKFIAIALIFIGAFLIQK